MLGEGVGFFKVARDARPLLEETARRHAQEGNAGGDYESAIDRFLPQSPVGYVKVGDLAWTEIDFPADVERAAREILPRVLAAERT